MNNPRGKLSKEEFYTAIKLVAIKQGGGEISLASIGAKTSLPKLGSGPKPAAAPTPTAQPEPEPEPSASGGDCDVSAHATALGLSASDVVRYDALWEEADTAGDYFPAGAAVKFLGTAGLPQSDLGKIWTLSDKDVPKGKLSKDEFYTALKLVAMKQSGGEIGLAGIGAKTALPKLGSNPEGTVAAETVAPVAKVESSGGDADAAPILSEHAKKLCLSGGDVKRYDALWEEAGTTDGFLAAGAAVKFLGTSGLPQADLGKIWGMSDYLAPKGKLSKDEFFVACKLVAIKQSGGEMSMANCANVAALPKLGANQTAEPAAPAETPATSAVLPDIAKKLSLTMSDYNAYVKFWAGVDKTDEFFPAGAAVKFLGASGLPQATLGQASLLCIPSVFFTRFRYFDNTLPYLCRNLAQALSRAQRDLYTHPITHLYAECTQPVHIRSDGKFTIFATDLGAQQF